MNERHAPHPFLLALGPAEGYPLWPGGPFLKPAILVTTTTFPRGEDDRVSARFVLDLVLRLERRFRVHVLAPDAPGVASGAAPDGVEIHRYRYFVPRSLQRLTTGEGLLARLRSSRLARIQAPPLVLAQLAVLPRTVRSLRVDLINSHWMLPQGLTGALWARRLGVPHVVTCHAAGVCLLDRLPGGRRLARWIADRTDLFLPVSADLAGRLETLVGRPVPHRVVPMGVDTERFHPEVSGAAIRRRFAPGGEKLVLFVGKLVPKKGVPALLLALAHLPESVRLLIAGGGPLAGSIDAAVEHLGLRRRVERLGWVPNPELPPLFAAADAVCVPSVADPHGETEGTPVVVLEALATGRPLVASAVGGIPEVVRDGRNGHLVPPGDAGALARALEEALATSPDPAVAREAARRYRWEAVAGAYAKAFDTLLAHRGAKRRGG